MKSEESDKIASEIQKLDFRIDYLIYVFGLLLSESPKNFETIHNAFDSIMHMKKISNNIYCIAGDLDENGRIKS